MGGYFGTEAQQRLQEKSDRMTPWIMRTPGACLTGRLMATDDPDRLGWDVIHHHLHEDGAFSFRWIDEVGLTEIRQQVEGICNSIFGWNGYCNTAEALRANIAAETPAPEGLRVETATGATVTELQAFLATQGITPLSAAVLTGEICNARALMIRLGAREIVAAGFVGMMQNHHSPLHDCAWVGLIGCAPEQRGRGLGGRITRALIRTALDDLGAQRVMAGAAADNKASVAMLTGAGLIPTNRASYVATLSETRFTR